MLRLKDIGGVTHNGTWTFGEWIGRTVCGFEFATPKNQWQRYTLEGLLIAKQTPYGGLRMMIVLKEHASVDCMSCLVGMQT